ARRAHALARPLDGALACCAALLCVAAPDRAPAWAPAAARDDAGAAPRGDARRARRGRVGLAARARARLTPAPSSTVEPMDELVEIRRSRRARRWTLRAPWGEPVRLTVPARFGEAEIEEVLESHREWIARERARQVPRLRLDSSKV